MHASEIKVHAESLPATGVGIRGEKTVQVITCIQFIEVNGNA